jgi:hypothetical protein
MASSQPYRVKMKGLWEAKSPDDEMIVAMTTALNALKGQLKLDPTLSFIVNKGNKKGNNKGKKKKNKKNTHNWREQKKDEAWKKEPPKDGEKHENKLASILTIGVNTTWHGLSTSLLPASLANSTRKNRRRSPRGPTLPLLLLLLLPR